ncbi:MAG: PD40 domain-containing protein [Akkermansiaceae bacterium]|nr:PD40 domain-containing protein [Akkermansiaceae bacterium]
MFRHTRLLVSLFITLSCPAVVASHPIKMAAFPALSPDGTRILFSWHGDIWTAAASGGKAERLTTHPAWDSSPVYTPDGKSICFMSTRDGGNQVFMMSSSGGRARQLTFHSEGSALEDIAPDGKSILVRGLRDFPGLRPFRLFQVSLDGKSPEKLAFPAYAEYGRFSPDGKSIIFTREGVEIYRKGYHGTMASQVWINEGESFTQPVASENGCRSPVFHPDGSGFFYTKGSPNGFNLWFHDKDGNDRQVTHFEDDSVLQPAIARQGGAIIFRHLFDLYVLPLTKAENDAGQPQKLDLWHDEDLADQATQERVIRLTNDASFSPSGLEIVFIAEGDIWAMDTILRKPHRLTFTSGHEKDVWFSHDGKSIFHLYDDGIDTEIRRLEKSNPNQYWWEAEDCGHSVIVNASERPESIYPGPKGRKIAYTTYPGNLWVSNPDGTEPTRLLESWSSPSVRWSPDGKWLAYTSEDDDFNPDVSIIPSDGSSAPVNISCHPDRDFSPVWSPDGRRLAFVGRHHKEEYDIFFLDLYKSDRAKDRHGETRERARKAMEKDPAYKGNAKKSVKKVIRTLTGGQQEQEYEQETFDLENVHQRLQKITVKGVTPTRLIWNNDSKRILFQARGGKTTYAVEAKPDAKPVKFADAYGTPIRMTDKGQLFWISEGVPAVLAGGKNTKYTFSVYAHRNLEAWKRMIFRTAWKTMRDTFYDPSMNNRDWNSIREKYEDIAAGETNSKDFDRVTRMMLGELNASHTGFLSTVWPKPWSPGRKWQESTVHLGLRFDEGFQGKGWKVKDVFPRGPADQLASQIEIGEIITRVDGVEIAQHAPLTRHLNRRAGEPVQLTVTNSEGEERDVKILPISYTAARRLEQNARLDQAAQAVDKASGGKLGYIHVAKMMWDEFEKFEHHLYEQGAGKEGLVIDVRDNGGGFTSDHLLTALCQPRHAFTVPRNGGAGYPQDRIVYATWHKPIIVLCNQNSFSNAEIFVHAIRNLKRGKVVGVATAGGVISTGSTKLLNIAHMRLPFRGWFSAIDGKDLELNGAKPDVSLWNKPGELSRGKDVQLEKAVQILLNESSKARGYPKARYRNAR